MFKLLILGSLATLLLLSSCGNDNISAGVKGKLNYGEGNCSLDHSFRYYNPYNGYVYLLNQMVKDTFSGNYNELINYSDSILCTTGEFTIALETGNYYVFIKEYPNFSNENFVTVNYNQVTEKEFFIYRCM